MPFTENLSVFFSDFAVDGELGDGTIIKVIFDKASDAFDFKSEGLEITALIQSSDAQSISRGDAITIENKTYSISQILPEDDGKISKLILSE